MAAESTRSTLTVAEAEATQQQTCLRLGIGSTALFVGLGVLAFVVPEDFSRTVSMELAHAGITALLLLIGRGGDGLARMLANLSVMAGILYLAPVIYLGGLLVMLPLDNAAEQQKATLALVYFSVLVVYYGVAFFLLRRANALARQALLR
jgi:hypothetical protein